MGIKNWLHNKHMSDPVDGTLQLTACTSGGYNSEYATCRMQGVVTAPGLAPTAVEHVGLAPTKKWPQPGQTIPVTVDRADPTGLEIRWKEIPTGRQLGFGQAQMLAAQMDQMGDQIPGQMPSAGSGQAPFDQPGVTSVFASGTVPPQLQAMLDRMISAAQESGASVTVTQGPVTVSQVTVGDPGRPMPGMPGGGLTPEQAAAAASGGAAALGMQPATARVLAVHEVPIPAGMPGVSAAGAVDLTLDVALPGGSGYSTMMRVTFSTPEKRAKVASVGATLPVLVNPARRDQIAIDTSRMFYTGSP